MAASGHLSLEFDGIERRLYHFYFCPVEVQFFGYRHRKRGLDALSDFRVGRKDGCRAVAVDGQIGVEIKTAFHRSIRYAGFEFSGSKKVEA